jgi:hypothetical protein
MDCMSYGSWQPQARSRHADLLAGERLGDVQARRSFSA